MAAVGKDAVEVGEQREGELLEGRKALPAQAQDPLGEESKRSPS